MFSQDDYKEYFFSLAEKERSLAAFLHQIKNSLKQQAIRQQVDSLLQEELESYSLAMSLLDDVSGFDEKRRSKREPKVGQVKLHLIHGKKTLEAELLNMSSGGITVELSSELLRNEPVEVEISFADGNASMSQYARVCWCDKIGPNIYKSGLQFQ